MSVCKKFLILLILISTAHLASGQAASSPFSTFGIGESFGSGLIQHQGMGGTGVAQPQFWAVNNQNPALLVFNYYTSFQAGALLESRTVSSDTLSLKNVNGNMAYLVTAFPVKPGKWTTSAGLTPFTKVNYRLSYEDYIRDEGDVIIDTAIVTEQGTGGLSQFYWANGVRIHKNFSVGLKAAYLFGSMNGDYSSELTNSNTTTTLPFQVAVNEQTYVKDFLFTAGLSFSKDSLFSDNYRLSIGATYSPGANLKASKNTVIQRRVSTGTPLTSDTLITRRGTIYIPPSLTMGVSLSKGVRWSGAMEIAVQDWSKFTSLNDEDESSLEKAFRFSAGGEFTPDQLAFNNYLMRVTYRAGFSYEKNPFSVNGKQVTDFGINFGFSLPTGRSSIDWAFKIGKRGDKAENVLEETYYKVYFGITFNDQWFIRRKFD